MGIQFNPLGGLDDLYRRAEQIGALSSSALDKLDGSFKIAIGLVKWHSQDHTGYEVWIPSENKVVKNVILFFDPYFYAINGYPIVGEKVKMLHQINSHNAYILGRVNTLVNQVVLDNNCSIAKGINIP